MPRQFRDIGRVGQGRTRLLAGICTVVLHLAVLAMAIWFSVRPSSTDVKQTPALVMVSVAQQPGAPQALSPPDVALLKPAAPPVPVLAHLHFSTAPAVPSFDMADRLTAAQLAGAVRAGQGSGGGGCDMAAAVQQALRHDPLVHAAVADTRLRGRAILLWNGDWVRAGDQAGKGLSAVREAVLWEVGFAPKACRDARMHGLVLLSLNNENTRFVIGAPSWRWSDLLGVRPRR